MEKEKNFLLNEDVLQPHDTDTEHAVLATLIRYNEKYLQYCDILSKELFYYKLEQAMFVCIEGVIKAGGITDINSLNSFAYSNDVGYDLNREHFLSIISLANRATFEQDVSRLLDLSRRRLCWLMLQQSAKRVLDVTVDIDESINGIMESVGEIQASKGESSVSTYRDALDEVRKVIRNNIEGRHQNILTGFKMFDDYFLLQPNTLTVIAAFTSVGKSALALNISMNVAKQGIPLAYYSLEMGKGELSARTISGDMSMSAKEIMNKAMSERSLNMFDSVYGRYKDLPIYFDDRSTVSFDKTMRSIRTLVKTAGIRLAIIDYLQIYSQVSDDAEESLSYMARSAKNIAKETGIAVILLSQLNRNGLHPSIKMLRGSGQIEESADNIVLIDRPEAYPDNKVTRYEGTFKEMDIKGTAKFILAKGRGVGTGSCLVGFNGMYTRFFEIEPKVTEKYREKEEDMPF